MSTETQIIIEWRSPGRKWEMYESCLLGGADHNEETAKARAAFFQKDFNESEWSGKPLGMFEFRAVRITTTREIL